MEPADRADARARRAAVRFALTVMTLVVSVLVPAARADAKADRGDLEVVIQINAAGDDVVRASDDDGRHAPPSAVVRGIADGLGLPPARRWFSYDLDYVVIGVHGKLAKVSGDRFIVPVDSGPLQVLAAEQDYSGISLMVCVPRVRFEVHTLVFPDPADSLGGADDCHQWDLAVNDPAVTGNITLLPNRTRYGHDSRTVLVLALAVGLFLGAAAWALRQGPLRQRTVLSWVLGLGSAALVCGMGWVVTTTVLLFSGAAADPIMLTGGTVGEQMMRTVVPGLAFLPAAIAPLVLLLGAPPRPKKDPSSGLSMQGAPYPNGWWSPGQWAAWAGSTPHGQTYRDDSHL